MTDFCQEQGISLLCYGTVAGDFCLKRIWACESRSRLLKIDPLPNINDHRWIWRMGFVPRAVSCSQVSCKATSCVNRPRLRRHIFCIFLRLLALLSVPWSFRILQECYDHANWVIQEDIIWLNRWPTDQKAQKAKCMILNAIIEACRYHAYVE